MAALCKVDIIAGTSLFRTYAWTWGKRRLLYKKMTARDCEEGVILLYMLRVLPCHLSLTTQRS